MQVAVQERRSRDIQKHPMNYFLQVVGRLDGKVNAEKIGAAAA